MFDNYFRTWIIFWPKTFFSWKFFILYIIFPFFILIFTAIFFHQTFFYTNILFEQKEFCENMFQTKESFSQRVYWQNSCDKFNYLGSNMYLSFFNYLTCSKIENRNHDMGPCIKSGSSVQFKTFNRCRTKSAIVLCMLFKYPRPMYKKISFSF